MKGTARGPQWPAPATTTDASREKHTESRAEAPKLSAITLALLDEYSIDSGTRGYDPYNKQAIASPRAASRRKL
jgi:hypothetical protein